MKMQIYLVIQANNVGYDYCFLTFYFAEIFSRSFLRQWVRAGPPFTSTFLINLHTFLNKYQVVKKSTLFSNYFKSNFKLMKKECYENVDIFGHKE